MRPLSSLLRKSTQRFFVYVASRLSLWTACFCASPSVFRISSRNSRKYGRRPLKRFDLLAQAVLHHLCHPLAPFWCLALQIAAPARQCPVRLCEEALPLAQQLHVLIPDERAAARP